MPFKHTNKFNLPETYVRAVSVDKHVSKGDISVTTLIDAPQIRQLKKKEYTVDVIDMFPALFGTSVHHILERSEIDQTEASEILIAAGHLRSMGKEKAADKLTEFAFQLCPELKRKKQDILLEQTLVVEVNGMTISGTVDKFNNLNGLLEDYKTMGTSAYKDLQKNLKKYADQQNIYSFMLKEHGYEVKAATITAVFKDWGKMVAKVNKAYPPYPLMNFEIELKHKDTVRDYISKRVALHRRADEGEVIPCTEKERWSEGDTYAVMATGQKRAKKVGFVTETSAWEYAEENPKIKKPYVEKRMGTSLRCDMYCEVRDICPQNKARRAEMEPSNEIDELIG